MKANELAKIAQSVIEQMPVEYNKPEFNWNDELSIGSHKKVNSIIKQVEELALKGYGSVKITLDKTTDVFMVSELENRFYSETEVCNLLCNEEFTLEPIEDYYDAQSYLLVWHKDLLKYPKSIGMDI